METRVVSVMSQLEQSGMQSSRESLQVGLKTLKYAVHFCGDRNCRAPSFEATAARSSNDVSSFGVTGGCRFGLVRTA